MTNARVLVVDDSVVVRRLVADVLAEDPRIEVVGTAANGRIALAKIEQLQPDLVTLDVEMPVMNGLETLDELRPRHPLLPVVMFSTLTARGARSTFEALEKGANEYVTKPSNVGSVAESREAVREQLVPKIHALVARARWARLRADVEAAGSGPTSATAAPAPAPLTRERATEDTRVDVVAIGASTGGPDAISAVLTALGDGTGRALPVPVLVTVHMPAVFTASFADRLAQRTGLRVAEARDGDPVEPGRVLVAPGGWHLQVTGPVGGRVVALDQGPQENFCRPAVDVMFRSVAAVYGRHALGVVLTGMGADGARGALLLAQGGAQVLVQDEATSVVWGMPGATVAAGAAHDVLALADVAPAIVQRCRAGRQPAAAASAPRGVLA